MLPYAEPDQRLRPSFPLLEKGRPFLWHVCKAYGIFRKPNLVAGFPDLLGYVAVKSGTYVPPSHFTQHIGVKRAECA